MDSIWWALFFMSMGGTIVEWYNWRAWKMYQRGRHEQHEQPNNGRPYR